MAWTTEELAEFFERMPDHPKTAATRARELIRRHIQADMEHLSDTAVDRRHSADDAVKAAVSDAIMEEYARIFQELDKHPADRGANDR